MVKFPISDLFHSSTTPLFQSDPVRCFQSVSPEYILDYQLVK